MERFLRTRLIELAESQHGLLRRLELLALGVPASTIENWIARGFLRPVDRGVYALGHAALRDEGRWLAAVWATGAGTGLSYWSGAALWRMRVPFVDAVHVSTTRRRKSRPGVVVHVSRGLTPADLTVHRGIPVTTVTRTIIDLADVLTYEELRRLVDRGVRLDEPALRRAMARHPGRHGAPNLRRLIGGGELRTRAGTERRMLRICREHGLPHPQVNARVLGRERDLVWPGHRAVIEVDGDAWHGPKPAREEDAERDADLTIAGWRVIRIAADDVYDRPAHVACRAAKLLGCTP